MMERGEVRKEDWMYCLDGEEEKSEWVLKVSNDAHVAFLDASNKLEASRIKELEADVEYLNKEYEKMEAKLLNYQEAIRRCYLWARNVKKDKTPWPEFKKEILKLEEDLPWEDNQ